MMDRWLRNTHQRARYGVSTRFLEKKRKAKQLPPPRYPFGTFPANLESELTAWDGMTDAEKAEYLLRCADRTVEYLRRCDDRTKNCKSTIKDNHPE
jgi:hypothetical protein